VINAERFADPCTSHGEGLFWDSVDGRLLLVDCHGTRMVRPTPPVRSSA